MAGNRRVQRTQHTRKLTLLGIGAGHSTSSSVAVAFCASDLLRNEVTGKGQIWDKCG